MVPLQGCGGRQSRHAVEAADKSRLVVCYSWNSGACLGLVYDEVYGFVYGVILEVVAAVLWLKG